MSRLLIDAGEALYGPQWQSALARDLKVSSRTVRRWASGESPVPLGAYSDVTGLCLDRSEALLDLVERLNEEADRLPPSRNHKPRRLNDVEPDEWTAASATAKGKP